MTMKIIFEQLVDLSKIVSSMPLSVSNCTVKLPCDDFYLLMNSPYCKDPLNPEPNEDHITVLNMFLNGIVITILPEATSSPDLLGTATELNPKNK